MNDSTDKQALAFEYVLGTLSDQERQAAVIQMRSDQAFAEAVRFWETRLMSSPESIAALEPKTDTFSKIQGHIARRSEPHSTERSVASFWQKLIPWKVATAIAFSMLLVVSGFLTKNAIQLNRSPNTDYVAVLVNESDQPVLTALTASDGSKLWLKWENWQPPQGHSLQLWSQSRRDGEIRPLLVFDDTEQQVVSLDQASWRLIKDSSHLIITREARGGSAIDEPSNQVIAKGVCIRLVKRSGNT